MGFAVLAEHFVDRCFTLLVPDLLKPALQEKFVGLRHRCPSNIGRSLEHFCRGCIRGSYLAANAGQGFVGKGHFGLPGKFRIIRDHLPYLRDNPLSLSGGSAAMKLTDKIRSIITFSGEPVWWWAKRFSRSGLKPSAGKAFRHFWEWKRGASPSKGCMMRVKAATHGTLSSRRFQTKPNAPPGLRTR